MITEYYKQYLKFVIYFHKFLYRTQVYNYTMSNSNSRIICKCMYGYGRIKTNEGLGDLTQRNNITRFIKSQRQNTPIHNILSTAPQFSLSQKALGTIPEDGNVMPKHVGDTIHN
jgi:hypothetical protein